MVILCLFTLVDFYLSIFLERYLKKLPQVIAYLVKNDECSNKNSNGLDQIADDVDESSSHIDVTSAMTMSMAMTMTMTMTCTCSGGGGLRKWMLDINNSLQI